MNTIFLNSKNSKTSDPDSLLLNFTDKIDLRRCDKHVALSNLTIYYTWKNKKALFKNNKFEILAHNWIKSDGSNSVSDMQDYFEYIKKKKH